jgi:hypothetical protein
MGGRGGGEFGCRFQYPHDTHIVLPITQYDEIDKEESQIEQTQSKTKNLHETDKARSTDEDEEREEKRRSSCFDQTSYIMLKNKHIV